MSKQIKQSRKYCNDAQNAHNTKPKRNIVTPFKNDNDNSKDNSTEISRNDNNKIMKTKRKENISEYTKPSLPSSQTNML